MRHEIGWWDRFLIGLFPTWGLKRVRARASARHYEAAQGGRRTENWFRASTDANTADAAARGKLRELSRDMRRNNGWARRAIQVIVGNTVGWGILPRPDDVNRRRSEQGMAVWKAWADSTTCDFDGRLTFYGLQRLVMVTVAESGEALVIKQPAQPRDGLPVPMRIQVLEPDYLDASKDGFTTTGGGTILQGIEFDKEGRRIAYWLYPQHPGGSRVATARVQSERIPADRVLHVYFVDRPGQLRGVPWLAAAIARLKDFDEFEDAELLQKKIAACFAAFVQDVDGSSTALGEQAPDEKQETLEPGLISYLPPGKSVTFASPPQVTESTFTDRQLRAIAASLGITFEDLSGDYSGVNFSSARMARLAHWQNVHDWRWHMVIPQLCDQVWRWVMAFAKVEKGWTDLPVAQWAAPPMPMLEPDKEGLAYQRLIRTGMMTLPQAIRERGEDPDSHLKEYAETNKRLDELKLILDSDPRKTNSSGQGQGQGQAAAPPGKAGKGAPGDLPADDGKEKPDEEKPDDAGEAEDS